MSEISQCIINSYPGLSCAILLWTSPDLFSFSKLSSVSGAEEVKSNC